MDPYRGHCPGKGSELTESQGHVREMNMAELEEMNPWLRLHDVIQSHPRPGNTTIDTVEVVFPEYFAELEKTLAGRTKETVRSYMLFQAFIQTQGLWDMDWAKRYHAHTWDWWGTVSSP